jgi:MFS family permease
VITQLLTISALLSGIALLLLGNGLLTTLITLRGSAEGLDERTLGVVTSCYFGGFLLGIYLAPRLVRRIGHIRAFAFCAGLLAATTLIYGLRVNGPLWMGLRVLTGLGIATLYAVIESWLNYQTPAQQRGQIFAIYMIVNLGALALAQQFIRLASPLEFVLFALAAIFVSLALMPVAWTRLTQPQIAATALMPLRRAWDAAPLALAGILAAGLVMGAFWGLAPLYASNLGFDRAAIAVYMTASILGGALFQWPLGWLSDTSDRRWMLFAVAAGATLGAAALGLAPQLLPGNAAALYVAAGLHASFSFSLYSIAITHLIDRITHDELMAGTGTLLFVYGIGATLGPAVAGAAMGAFGNGALPAFYLVATALLAAGCLRQLRRRPDLVVVEAPAHFMPMLRTGPAALALHPDSADPPPHPSA